MNKSGLSPPPLFLLTVPRHLVSRFLRFQGGSSVVAVLLCVLVISYVEFVLSLFVSLLFLWCLRKAVPDLLHFMGIFTYFYM